MEKERTGIYMMEACVSPHRSDFRLFKTSIFFLQYQRPNLPTW